MKTNSVMDILMQTGQFKSKNEIKRLEEAIWVKVDLDDIIAWPKQTIFKIGKRKFIAII